MIAKAEGWGSWHRCPKCDLEFVDPLRLAEPPETLYGEAYEGGRAESAMTDFSDRVAQRKVFMADPTLWFWSPAFEQALAWLDRT
ncbi:MAG TPA: hypothetical protein VFH13_04340, partial [Gemmatimonadaceae bacterium]|nr:hypothetical protein [Gemmatimonadaceae bacterium]